MDMFKIPTSITDRFASPSDLTRSRSKSFPYCPERIETDEIKAKLNKA